MTGRLGRRWLTEIAVALGLTVIFTSQLYIWVNLWPMRVGWGTALLWALPQLALWGLSIPLLIRLSRRWTITAPHRGRDVLGHALASIAYAGTVLLVIDLSDRLLGWTRLMGAPSFLVSDIGKTVLHLHMGMAVYWVVIAADHAVRFHGEARNRELVASRLEAQLADAKLTALRMQVHPHFLFNTLNAIAVLMRRDSADAERMLHRLSDFLRVTLEDGDVGAVPLEREMAILESYLAIEKARFGERLTVRYAIPTVAMQAIVPSLLLQPLVENALRHGLAPRAAPGILGIEARVEGERLVLEVWDDGVGVSPAAIARPGVGLGNVVARLATRYGAQAGLRVEPRSGGGTRAVLRLPYETSVAADQHLERDGS